MAMRRMSDTTDLGVDARVLRAVSSDYQMTVCAIQPVNRLER